MARPCANDVDCLSDQFCYFDSDGEGLCDCNFLRGHVLVAGTDLSEDGACSAYGRGAVFTLIFLILQLIAALALFVYVLYYYSYLSHELVYWSDANCKNLYLITFGIMSFFFWRAVNMKIVATSGDLPNVGQLREGDPLERYHRLFGVEAAAVGLLTCCLAILVSNIGNMWLDKGLRIQFSTIEYEKKKLWLDRFRTVLNGGAFIIVPAYAISFTTNSFFAALGALVYLSLYALLLVYSYVKIRKLLMFCIDDSSDLTTLRAYKPSQRSQKLMSELEKLEDYVKIFNITGIGLLISYLTFIFGVVLFFSLIFRDGGWKSVANEKRVNPVLYSVELVSVSTLCFLASAAYFCSASFRQLDAVKLRRKSDMGGITDTNIGETEDHPESSMISGEQPYSEMPERSSFNYTA